MKTFWKILPLCLPLLAILFVLSSCGKGDKITGNIFNKSPKDDTKTVSGQRKNGAPAPTGLDPEVMKKRCANMRGQADMKQGLCVVQVSSEHAELDPASIGVQTILQDYQAGDLIISSVTAGTLDKSLVDIQLAAEHLMNIGERKVADKSGPLSFVLLGKVPGSASVSVWTCYDKNLDHTRCNEDLFKR